MSKDSERQGFILFYEFRKPISKLPLEDAGALLNAIFQYEEDGTIAELPLAADVLFELIRNSLDRSAERYENIRERNRENINKRHEKGKKDTKSYEDKKSDTRSYEILPNSTKPYETLPKDTKSYEALPNLPTVAQTQKETGGEGVAAGAATQGATAPLADSAPSAPSLRAVAPALPSTSEKRRAFVPPSVGDIAAFCRDENLQLPPAKCAKFVSHYAAKKWTLGNGLPMSDWREGVRSWIKRERPTGQPPPSSSMPKPRTYEEALANAPLARATAPPGVHERLMGENVIDVVCTEVMTDDQC